MRVIHWSLSLAGVDMLHLLVISVFFGIFSSNIHAQDSRPLTSIQRVFSPVLDLRFHKLGTEKVGEYQNKSGEKRIYRDDLEVAEKNDSKKKSLLHIAHLSDSHIIDEESPARFWRSGFVNGTVFRYQDAYSTHVLDAMVGTINQLNRHAKNKKLDFAVVTGDLIDNSQRNEMEWFFQVMDGKDVTPNSGDQRDNPLPSQDNPHIKFKAQGLDIPYFITPGNHDLAYDGFITEKNRRFFGVPSPTATRAKFQVAPKCSPRYPILAACTPYNPLLPSEKDHYWSLKKRAIVGDNNREKISAEDIYRISRDSDPINGHGYGNKDEKRDHGHYSRQPVSHIPIQLINIDTSKEGTLSGVITRDTVNNFLIPWLDETTKKGNEKLVILMSHHPLSHILPGRGKRLFEKTVKKYPNIFLHLVGHGHKHDVVSYKGDEAGSGYWEIQTASLIEWPQQARLVEVALREDGVGEVITTVIDYGESNSIATDSRALSILTKQIPTALITAGDRGDLEDRNLNLPFKIPPNILKRLVKIQSQLPEIESSTY